MRQDSIIGAFKYLSSQANGGVLSRLFSTSLGTWFFSRAVFL